MNVTTFILGIISSQLILLSLGHFIKILSDIIQLLLEFIHDKYNKFNKIDSFFWILYKKYMQQIVLFLLFLFFGIIFFLIAEEWKKPCNNINIFKNV